MKRFLSLILVLMMLALPVFGAQMDNTNYVVDDAGLLTDSEEQSLKALAEEISLERECQLVIVTTDSLGGKSATAYADDYFDYNSYGYGSGDDGILFLVAMQEREWAISTYGFAVTAFTDYGQEYLMDRVLPDLSGGEYYDAFETWLETGDDLLRMARNGEPLDESSSGGIFMGIVKLLMCLVAGFLLALIPMSMLKKEINNVRSQSGAGDYVRSGSMQVTAQHDRFLYSHVSKRPRPKNNSSSGGGGSRTHRSSSGRSHGGSSGRF